MNSFLAGALGGISGAAGTYQKQQKDQMEFNQQQQMAAAADLRKRNYARWDYEQKDLYSGSSMVDPSGREYSKKEVQEGPGQALTPKHEWTRKQEEIKAGKKEEKRVEILKEKRGHQEGLAEEKAGVAQIKTDAKYVKDTMKEVRQDIKDADEGDKPGSKFVAILSKGEQQDDERFFNSPEYKEAASIQTKSVMFAEIFEAQKGIWSGRKSEKNKAKAIFKKLKKDKDGNAMSTSDEEINNIVKYLDYYNTFK